MNFASSRARGASSYARSGAHFVLARGAMARAAPAVPEYVLEAEIAYLSDEGATGLGYPSIVVAAPMPASCITSIMPHLPEDGLVLIDAGAEYQGYAADITRTFPASGRYGPPAPAWRPRLCRADRGDRGRAPWGDFQRSPSGLPASTIAGLIELGVLTGTVEAILADGAMPRFGASLLPLARDGRP